MHLLHIPWDKHAPDCEAPSQALAETWSGLLWVTHGASPPCPQMAEHSSPLTRRVPAPAVPREGVWCRYNSSQELCGSTRYHGYFPDPTHQRGCCLPAWARAEPVRGSAERKHALTASNQAICNLRKRGGQGVILLLVLLATEQLVQTKLPRA